MTPRPIAIGLACLLALTMLVDGGAALQSVSTEMGESGVTLTGFRTATAYWPTLVTVDGAPNAEVPSCLRECLAVPANEWLRVTVSTTPFGKVRITGCYQDCRETIGVSTTADASGRAHAILPPVRAGETELLVYVQKDGRETVSSHYAVSGSLPRDSREVILAPLNEWARVNISVLAPGEYFVAIRIEQHPFVTDIRPEHQEAPAAAIFTDVEGTRSGHNFASTRYFFASNDMDLHAAVSTSILEADVRVSSLDTPAGNTAANPLAVQGIFSAGELSIQAVIARAGSDGGPPVHLIAFSPSGTGMKIDVSETGSFIAAASKLQSGAQASAAGTGPLIGTVYTEALASYGMVIAGIRTGVDGQAVATIRHNDTVISRNLSPLQSLVAIRDGPCDGLWGATASATTTLIGSVETVVAYADGLILSDFARRTYGSGPGCEL